MSKSAYIQIDEHGIDVGPCLEAVTKMEQRRSWLVVGLTSLLAIAWTIALFLQLDLSHQRRQMGVLRSELSEAQIRLTCTTALLNRTGTESHPEAWLRACFSREARRRERK